MTIQDWLLVGQGICLLITTITILLQNRGSGLSGALGGSDDVYLTRRGVEKSIVNISILFLVLFVVLRFAALYLPQ